MLKTTWNTGSKDIIDFNDIIEQIKEHTLLNGTIYIGTDSFFVKNKCIFATAICLYGADNQQGGRYFYIKTSLNKKQFPELSIRMIKEAEKTINLANHIVELIPTAKLELHLDISPQENSEGTSHLAKMLVGYVKGSGYECRIKPYAFAAASIADKHSK
tara:strand:- start:1717 stop:2193 length:477 start_codon:yes stop_codon:yes gene_type:complete